MAVVRAKNDLAPAAAAAAVDDMGDGMAMCSNHPYRSNLGGICAFCLQEKLGKLVSSSFPFPIPNASASASSSSPVSFASDVGPVSAAHSTVALGTSKTTPSYSVSYAAAGGVPSTRPHYPVDADAASRRARIPFLLARRRKKKKQLQQQLPPGPPCRVPAEAVLKRSKSSAGPRRHFMDVLGDGEDEDRYSQRTRRGGGGGFWSFLHLSASSSSSSKSAASRKGEKPPSSLGAGDSKVDSLSVFEESPGVNGNQFPAFERKVSRSRSVGCGSRSFSGDFFERISTGFGDCTLRRVESHREGHSNRTPKQAQCQQQAQKIYKCGGIFGGFMMIAAPSASYWADDHHQHPGKSTALANGGGGNSRARSWSWAFPSPMRAFAKPGKDQKREISIVRDGSTGKNTGAGPNLSAIPSLLTVGG